MGFPAAIYHFHRQISSVRGKAGPGMLRLFNFVKKITTMAETPRVNHEIDYKIYGEELQFVEIELDPHEAAVGEAGAMFYMEDQIQLETIFGDGSAASSGGGFMDKLVGAGKRLITGESLFTTMFSHTGQGKARVAFAAPYPGTIVPMTLSNYGGKIICQKDAFLCAARGVSIIVP